MASVDAPGPVMLVLCVIRGKALNSAIVPVTLLANVMAALDVKALALLIAARSDPTPLSLTLVTSSACGAGTEMLLEVPVIEEVTVSVAVIVCEAEGVFNVAVKTPVPLVSDA